MSAPALIGRADVLQRKLAGIDPLPENKELALHGAYRWPAHFSHDAAGVRKNELSFEKRYPFLNGDNARLFPVQRYAKLGAYLVNAFQTIFKVLNILVNQIAVVHIPAVAFDSQLLLDNVVELVRKHNGRDLRDLTSQAVTDRPEVIEKHIRQVPHARVMHALFKLLTYRFVIRRSEVVLKIEY